MVPATGQKRVLKYYHYISWLLPLIKVLLPNMVSTMNQVALSMIYVSRQGYERNVIHVKDITILAEKEVISLPRF